MKVYLLKTTSECILVFSTKEKAEEHGMKMKPTQIKVWECKVDDVGKEATVLVQHVFID